MIQHMDIQSIVHGHNMVSHRSCASAENYEKVNMQSVQNSVGNSLLCHNNSMCPSLPCCIKAFA